MPQGKVIGTVNILDLRNATEASVAAIDRIGTAHLVVYTRRTADLVGRLNIGNVNATLEVPQDVNVQQFVGEVVINRNYFNSLKAPSYLLGLGRVIVEPDVNAEDVSQAVLGLALIGQLICPEPLAGVLQTKAQRLIGQVTTYPPFAQTRMGSLTLDEAYLGSLPDGSDLAVVGTLRAPRVLPDDLLGRKIRQLFVSGEARYHAENSLTLQARLVNAPGRVRIIPQGFELVDRPLMLDMAMLNTVPVRKLYCTGRVQVAADVALIVLDERLEGLASEEVILCPAALRDVLARKCNLLENQVVFYEGELWLVDFDQRLSASRFDYLQGQATVVVFGVWAIDPAVSPTVLAERLAKVHNFGIIRCTPDQMGALEARLGVRAGRLEDVTWAEGDETGGASATSATMLAL